MRSVPGSEVTVRWAVRTLRGRRVEVFVPLEAVPGKVAQANLGQAHMMIAGTVQKVSIFCLRAKLRGKGYIYSDLRRQWVALVDRSAESGDTK